MKIDALAFRSAHCPCISDRLGLAKVIDLHLDILRNNKRKCLVVRCGSDIQLAS